MMNVGIRKSLFQAAIAAGLATGAAEAQTTLTYGSPFPENHMLHEEALRPFFDRVEQATGDELTWELFVGGSMGGPLEALTGVGSGIVDSGVVMDLYFKSDLPVSVAVANLFVVADDLKVFVAAANDTFLTDCPQCTEEFAEHNIKPLAYYGSGPYVLMCREATRDLAGLQGKKVRASSRMGVLMSELGATPVSITSSEMYEALQRGQADCTVGGAAWLTSYGIKDVVTSILDLPLGTYYSGLFMDVTQDRWEELSQDQRQAIIDNLPQLVADAVWGELETAEAAKAEAIAAGGKIVEPAEDLEAALADFRAGETEYAIATATEAGVENPEQLMERFLANIEKWRGIAEEVGDDEAAYAAALDREVFSQIEP